MLSGLFPHVPGRMLRLLRKAGGGLALLAGMAFHPPFAEAQFRSDEVIVKLRPNVLSADAASLRVTLDAKVEKKLDLIKAELWKIRGYTAREAIAAFRGDPRVAYIEPNYKLRALQTPPLPQDPSVSQLWGLHNTGQSGGIADADIDAPEAWAIHTGTDVVVAVIDTGVDYTHKDLAQNTWVNPGEIPNNGIDDDHNGFVDDVRGWNFFGKNNNPMDDHGHGTHVSGTIGAVGNNGVGVAGVAWSVKIMALKFLGKNGSGTTADAISAIEYATKMKARLSSNSWGGGGASQALSDAIDASGRAGMLFVAAAGNERVNNDTKAHYPSNYPLDAIIAVAATDHRDRLSSFSNYGLKSVDLGAPGTNILSTYPGNRYQSLSGTSMATPHVAGAVALLWSLQPSLTAAQVKAQILATVDPIPALKGMTVSGGRLNLANMLQTLRVPTVSVDAPSDGSSFGRGSEVAFRGSAVDSEEGDLSSSLQWTSSLDGPIGKGASFATRTLTAGDHKITASATNRRGFSGTDSISLRIVRNDSKPVVSVRSPADGSSFAKGAEVRFSGTATDVEDGDLTSGLVWTSSLDGRIGGGGEFTTSSLSAGAHVITATVADGGGLSGSAATSILVGGIPSGIIDFNQTATVPYADQDGTGALKVEDNGATLTLTGNRWRRTSQTFDVSPFTVLEFDFESTSEGEIQGIGFDEDDSVTDGRKRLFQIFGTQIWANAVQLSNKYPRQQMGSFVHFKIRVGDYYTAPAMRLVFMSDKDAAPFTSLSRFRNVKVYEDLPSSAPLRFDALAMSAYDNQDGAGSVTVEDGGATLFMKGNRWRATEKTFVVTPKTRLVFEFMSTVEGESRGSASTKTTIMAMIPGSSESSGTRTGQASPSGKAPPLISRATWGSGRRS